jgi:glycosyltransferase involved in cell wall biosynthesis
MAYYPCSFLQYVTRILFYPFLDAVVLLTKNDAKHYKFHKNAVVIPNSLSFIPQKQSLLENKTILSVGRFSYQKGFDLLIEALSLIREQCNGWKLKIIGNGEDNEKLNNLIKEEKLETLIFLIPPTNNIEDEYYNASIYVMSSRYDPFGLVLIEAKSCGLPVVSFDCPYGPADIIRNGIDGFLVERNDVEELSQAILKLIKDENLRKQLGDEAVKDIDRFKPEYIGILWDELFIELLGSKGAAK